MKNFNADITKMSGFENLAKKMLNAKIFPEAKNIEDVKKTYQSYANRTLTGF